MHLNALYISTLTLYNVVTLHETTLSWCHCSALDYLTVVHLIAVHLTVVHLNAMRLAPEYLTTVRLTQLKLTAFNLTATDFQLFGYESMN